MSSRRNQITMTPDEIRTYITDSQTLIVVSNGREGFPHPVPLFYYSDDQLRIYVETYEKSQKVKNFERDPRATLLIESGKKYAELKSLIMYCDVKIITDKTFVAKIAGRVSRKHSDALDIKETPEEFEKRMEYVARKRVALEFTPRSFVSWDHSKLEGNFGPGGGG